MCVQVPVAKNVDPEPAGRGGTALAEGVVTGRDGGKRVSAAVDGSARRARCSPVYLFFRGSSPTGRRGRPTLADDGGPRSRREVSAVSVHRRASYREPDASVDEHPP